MNIENIINSYGSYIYNYALKLTCHPLDAEDIAQETFIKAWSHIDTLKNENALKAWLRKICFNIFLNKKKKADLNLKIFYQKLKTLKKMHHYIHLKIHHLKMKY